jgi:predicted enzyme related to lactoylglutathione lyase
VHLPFHPVWFWFVLAAPWVTPLLMWIAANRLEISLKPLAPWLAAAYVVFWALFTALFLLDDHKAARIVLFAAAYSSQGMWLVIKRHYTFETLRAPGTKWYFPWRAAGFSVPDRTHIRVRNIQAVSPWYVEKLGLRKLTESEFGESDAASFGFKQDGNSVVLTTRGGFRTGKTPILFTKKIGKMRNVMMARGVEVGDIQYDRQGIRYFDIRDPEGNEIEVVEER